MPHSIMQRPTCTPPHTTYKMERCNRAPPCAWHRTEAEQAGYCPPPRCTTARRSARPNARDASSASLVAFTACTVQAQLVAHCRALGVVPMAHTPLGGQPGYRERVSTDAVVREIATECQASPAQVAP